MKMKTIIAMTVLAFASAIYAAPNYWIVAHCLGSDGSTTRTEIECQGGESKSGCAKRGCGNVGMRWVGEIKRSKAHTHQFVTPKGKKRKFLKSFKAQRKDSLQLRGR